MSGETPCLVLILEKLGWRVLNNRRRLQRLEVHIEDAKKKNQPTTALDTQRDELKDELARSVDLLNDCAEWIRVRTGIPNDKLVEVATSTAFTEGQDRDVIYAKLGTLDERGLTAELWADLLSQHPEALESFKLLPSLESGLPTSVADEQRGHSADATSSPLAQNAEAEGSFNDQGEFVRICGFDEDVTIEKTPGVERLVAVVTAPTRRVAVMELVRIGAPQQALDRDSIDLDADGLTEQESINVVTKTRKRRESVLGDDASQAVRDEVGDLIEKKKMADERGNAGEAKALKQQIDATLNPLKTDATTAAKTVQNSLDRTYKRLRKDDKGNRLAAHFEKCVIRPRESSEYVYQPGESERKISWIAK